MPTGHDVCPLPLAALSLAQKLIQKKQQQKARSLALIATTRVRPRRSNLPSEPTVVTGKPTKKAKGKTTQKAKVKLAKVKVIKPLSSMKGPAASTRT
jgi:hypothetical protein